MSNKPNTIRQAIEGMTLSLDTNEAKDVNATIQFNLSGDDAAEYYLTVANGKCDFAEGTAAEADLTIESPADVWLKIARKELNGAMALMTGKYKASGKMGLLMKMDTLFSRTPTEDELKAKGWL